jgi:hypothetical protein
MPSIFEPDFEVTEENYEHTVKTLAAAEHILAITDAHAAALGYLCLSWAGLDSAVNRLFEPLLKCSSAQIGCIVPENVRLRCEALKRLLHIEPLPDPLVSFAVGLLDRASGELAPLRNRLIHDGWSITKDQTTRIDRRAKLGKPQSRRRIRVVHDTKHPTQLEEINRVSERISTVQIALSALIHVLQRWRSEGRIPELDVQWAPAATRLSRCLNCVVDPASPDRPLQPLQFEFD